MMACRAFRCWSLSRGEAPGARPVRRPSGPLALQAFEEEAAKEPCERLDGEEEVRSPGDPARPVGREAPARDDAMDVRMMGERLPPGMEDGEAADPCAEPARVCGERRHRFGRGREQD